MERPWLLVQGSGGTGAQGIGSSPTASGMLGSGAQSGILGMCRVRGRVALVPGQCNSRSFLEEAYSSVSSLKGLQW